MEIWVVYRIFGEGNRPAGGWPYEIIALTSTRQDAIVLCAFHPEYLITPASITPSFTDALNGDGNVRLYNCNPSGRKP